MRIIGAVLVVLCAAAAEAQQPDSSTVAAAVVKPIALLQKTAVMWYEKRTCPSCHQQDLPMMVFRLARERGITLDEAIFAQAVSKAFGHLGSVDQAVQHTHLIDPSMDYGMQLLGAHDAGVTPSVTTGIYARLIANRQQPDGSWLTLDERPPQSDSQFSATAIAMRAVQLYLPVRLDAEKRERVRRASDWLSSNAPRTTEDRVCQLRGLAWAGAGKETLNRLTAALLGAQRRDGGWSQLPRLESDAYATGEVLVALHDAGRLPTSNPAWQRGMQYLLKTQLADGTWLVKSRLHEQQIVSPPYFESGFPHGRNQMISVMGTTWATAALLETLEPSRNAAPAPVPTSLTPAVKPWMETALFGSPADLEKLLDRGIDSNSRTTAGTSILMMAAHDPEKVRLLLDRGADVNARSQTGFTALMVAANHRGASQSVRLLLAHGAEIGSGDVKPLFNASAVSYAVLAGDTETLGLLVAKGADLRQKMSLAGTSPIRPIDIAAAQHDAPMLRYLVSKGVNPNERDPDIPISALTQAAISNDLPVARTLIELGADVNQVDRLGMTTLQHAASIDFGDTEMVKLLLASGADPGLRTKSQQTAEQIAARYGHAAIAKELGQRPLAADR